MAEMNITVRPPSGPQRYQIIGKDGRKYEVIGGTREEAIAAVQAQSPQQQQQPNNNIFDGVYDSALRIGQGIVDLPNTVTRALTGYENPRLIVPGDPNQLGGIDWSNIGKTRFAENSPEVEKLKNPFGFTGNEFPNASNFIKDKRKELNYTPTVSWEQVKKDPSPGNVLAFMGEGAITSLPDMAAALLSAPGYFLSYISRIAEDRAKNDGRTIPTPEDLAYASVAAAGIAAAERFGAKGIFSEASGNAATRILKAGGKEKVTEAIQNPLEYAAGTIDTKKGFEPTEALDQAAAGAVQGFGAGTMLRGGVETVGGTARLFKDNGDLTDPRNMSPEGAAAAGDFARRLRAIAEANGYDLRDVGASSTKGARETVDKAHIQMAEELKKLFRDLGDAVKPTDKETFQETTDKILAQAAYREARNKTKSTVGQQEIDAMRRLVGNTAEGQQAINLMLQLNQLTEVHNQGYKGGFSRFTDVFNPFDQNINSYDGASRIVTGTLSPIATVATGVATGGSSVLPQAGIYGSGRAIDKLTGRRSRVDRFVRRNENNQPGLPEPSAPSSVASERLRAQQADEAAKRAEEETAALNLELTQKNAPPTPDSPQFTMEDATGLDRGGVARILRVLKGSNKSKALNRAISEYEQSVATGGRIKDLSPLIRAVRQFQEENPDYVPQVRPPNSLSNPQSASAPNAGGQTYGPRYTTPENYNRGIQDNIDANRAAVEGVIGDPDLNQAQKAQLATSLDVLANNLGADPVAAAEAQIVKLQEAGVPQDAIDAYVQPYVDRVIGQQKSKASPRKDAIDQALDAVKQAKDEANKAFDAKDKANARIDADVEAGKITEEEAKKLKLESPEFEAYREANKKLREADKAADQAVADAAAGRVSPEEPILGSINPEIPAPTTVQKAALSAPTPVVYQQIDAPEGETNHSLLPHLRVRAPSSREGKPLVLVETKNKNASRQIDGIDEVLARHEDPAGSPESWASMMGDALATDDVPVQPHGFIEDLNNGGAQKLLSTLTPGQIADADYGFAKAAEFRKAYYDGEIDVEDTGRLFLWGYLSRGVSPYVQESLFMDSFSGIDKWIKQASEGKLDLDAYKEWAKTAAPKGSGKPGAGATHNLNSFGQHFLTKMSQDAGLGDGRSRLQVLHDMMSDPQYTGKDIRRQFLRMGEGAGIDNKVVSFALLVTGYNDVMVLDRVQMRQMWNDGRFSGINLYDGYKNNGDIVNGSALSNLTYGARGLLVYEAMEKSLQKRLPQIYSDVGRPDAASVGRYHWETWVASSEQEASHGTIDAILRRSKGDPNPLDGVTAKEGEYGAFAYGARYGVENGVPMFTYEVPDRGEYKFTVPEFQAFQEDIKRKAKSNKVIPYGFSVKQSGNAPWYTREGVNLDALAEKANEYGTKVRTNNEGNGSSEAVPDGRTSNAPSGEPIFGSRTPIESAIRDTSPGANPYGPRPDVIPAKKPQVTPEQYKDAAVNLVRPQFQIGLKGGELEDGISNFNDAVEFARKLGIVVRLAMSQEELNSQVQLDTGKDPRKLGTVTGMFQPKGSTRYGKGAEGTIWAMKAGADKGDGTYVTDIEALTTLLHEIAHGITLGPLDGTSKQDVWSYFINRNQSSEAGTGIRGRSDFTMPGSFTDSAIRPLLEGNWSYMSPLQRKVFDEILNLQENVEAYSPKNPSERRAVRFIRTVLSNQLFTPSAKQRYVDYTRMAAEFAVDPVWVYLINPKLAKKVMPETSKMIQEEFRKANNKVIQFYAHPLAVVMAAFIALEKAMDDEEERKRQKMPPGVLNQPMQAGALSA